MCRPCPLCQANHARRLFVKDALPYEQCPHCGFQFIDSSSNPNFHTHIGQYEHAYIDYLEQRETDEANYRKLLDWLSMYADLSSGRLLDVGCGSGKWVRFLRRNGIEAYGLEPAGPLYRRYLAGSDAFLRARVPDLAAENKRSFAAITAADVIEHVDDVGQFAAGIGKLLAPGGIVLICTPDAGCLAARMAGRWWRFYGKYHRGYFSKATLGRLFGRLGMEPLYIGHRAREFTIGYLLRYAASILDRTDLARAFRGLDRVSICVNTHEILYAVFRKPH